MRLARAAVLAGWLLLFTPAMSPAADWPMYRADAQRSGYSPDRLPAKLQLAWQIEERHAPRPAWPTSERMLHDRAYRLAIAAGRLFYGTSADDRLVALDAAKGRLLWTRHMDAPIRFAPAVLGDRLFAVCDDGYLFCCSVASGEVLWKLRGGPRDELLMGNDRMIARWPARGGPVVGGGVVYFGAGIWPSEGIYLYAVDPASGKTLWCNDRTGSLEMNQPHPTARAASGTAVQGHLALADGKLLVPTGRAVPAAFDRASGELLYFYLQENRAEGGSEVVVFDDYFVNGGSLFRLGDGKMPAALGTKIAQIENRRVTAGQVKRVEVAVHPRLLIYADQTAIAAIDRKSPTVMKTALDRKGAKIKVASPARPVWSGELPLPAAALIVAGDRVIVGAEDRIILVDAETGEVLSQLEVEGTARELAVAEGRLYCSTDRGRIYCFAAGSGNPSVVTLPEVPQAEEEDAVVAAAAEAILRRSGVKQGICLDLGCGDGRLAVAIAQRTKLQIVAIDHDANQVAAARQRVAATEIPAARISVRCAATDQLPNYVADLIVSGRASLEDTTSIKAETIGRLLRPYGGVACLGKPGTLAVIRRGALEGAADWTHQYADPANTLCSADSRLRSPLHALWFRDSDWVMPSRHGRGPAPLVSRGRMFVEGLNGIRAVNIYNGTTLWEVSLPKILSAYHQDHLTGVAGTGSNLCMDGERLFVHDGATCLVLDAASGRKIDRWLPPNQADGTPGSWGYLACAEGKLFGSLSNPEHEVKESWRAYLGKLDMRPLHTESNLLFALDAKTGRRLWTFTAEHSIRHNAIAVGGGRVFVIDRPLAVGDRPSSREYKKHQRGQLVCLDAATGQPLWKAPEGGFGTLLALSQPNDVLLVSYQATSFRLDSERGGEMAGFRASDGKLLWEIPAEYKSRPILNGTAIYAEPGKWNLLTGEAMDFKFKRSYGCGILAGCERLLVYRSATLGYFDLEGLQRTENYGGIRPGCWINAIPAGGLVLLAEAASWCTCSYLNQATIALEPAE